MKKVLLMVLVLASGFVNAQSHRYDPPWNTPPKSAVSFTVPGIDNVPDLFGDINDPQLVIFLSGNEFMVIDELIAAFKKAYPAYERVFVETLPPGILAKQIEGGDLTVGNLRINLKPDVYTAGKSAIEQKPEWFSKTTPYAKNKLAIMVQKSNPKQIKGLADFNRGNIRISMPNPAWEGIGKRIEEAYVKAGGEELRNAVMQTKVKDSSTFLTQIHHRQSPMRILYNQSDVAPVWYTEGFYQKMIGNPVDVVEIPARENIESTSVAGIFKNAPHEKAAKDFVEFLVSEAGKAIFIKYGFNTKFN